MKNHIFASACALSVLFGGLGASASVIYNEGTTGADLPPSGAASYYDFGALSAGIDRVKGSVGGRDLRDAFSFTLDGTATIDLGMAQTVADEAGGHAVRFLVQPARQAFPRLGHLRHAGGWRLLHRHPRRGTGPSCPLTGCRSTWPRNPSPEYRRCRCRPRACCCSPGWAVLPRSAAASGAEPAPGCLKPLSIHDPTGACSDGRLFIWAPVQMGARSVRP